ncbi:high mobility group protein B3-like, partial [Arapaima gigas]
MEKQDTAQSGETSSYCVDTKGKKDPETPKMLSSNAFFLFCLDHQSKNPSLSFDMRMKKLADMWQNLSDADKQHYLVQAKELKDDYNKAMSVKEKAEFEEMVTQDMAQCGETSSYCIETQGKNNPDTCNILHNAFTLFCLEHRSKLNAENPGLSLCAVLKKLSDMWQNLPIVEMQPYLNKAKEQKDDYNKAMSVKEKARSEEMAKQDTAQCGETSSYSVKTKSKKCKLDPNTFKFPPPAFILFSAEHRFKIYTENPTLSPEICAKTLSDMWQNLSDADKQSYLTRAKALKDEYDKRTLAKEKAESEEMANQDTAQSAEIPSCSVETKTKKRKKDPDTFNNPPNAFILFSAEHRSKINAENPSLSSDTVSKMLSDMWQNLPYVDKEDYWFKAFRLLEECEMSRAAHMGKDKFRGTLFSKTLAKKLQKEDDDDDDDD